MSPTIPQVESPPFTRRVVELIVVVAIVLSWRVSAWASPSSLVTLEENQAIAMALLGVFFAGCGIWTRLARPNRLTAVFLLYGLGNGVHWGGPIGVSATELETSLFLVYLSFTLIGDAALLHLALMYPRYRNVPRMAGLVYLPGLLSLMLAPVAWGLSARVLEATAGGLLLIANLLSLAGGAIFIGHLFTVESELRKASKLTLIAVGIAAGAVTALLGAAGVLPGIPDYWSLALALIPAALAAALVSFEPE